MGTLRFFTMKQLLMTLAVGLIFTGCTKHSANVTEATVTQTAEHVRNSTATVFDANDGEYRKVVGVVPGAVLLDSISSYDLKVLPTDKARPVIFYCTSRT